MKIQTEHKPTRDPDMTEDDADRYGTPATIIDRVYDVFEGWPDLDPFADATSVVQAYERWDIREGQDAYALEWPANAKIFVNGPFSECKLWLKLCRNAYDRGATVIAVCRTACSSNYWRRSVFGFTSRCYCQPRIAFDWNTEPFGAPREDHTMLCYSHDGGEHDRFIKAFEWRGHIESDVINRMASEEHAEQLKLRDDRIAKLVNLCRAYVSTTKTLDKFLKSGELPPQD